MIDSRAKGRTGEIQARDELRKLTGLPWERTPMSGALGAQHKLKGDLYVPDTSIKYCVEVKFYKDDHVSSKLLTGNNPQLIQWWNQTVREAGQIDKRPLLLFKYNRSKWFALTEDADIMYDFIEDGKKCLQLYPQDLMICLLSDFCGYAEFKNG